MFNTLGNSIPRNGLVGEWLLDGNALDTSGNGYNLTPTNVLFVKTDRGYQSQAGSFNGTSSKAEISNDLGIAGGNITMSATVQLNTEISSGYYTIMKQNDFGSGVGFQMYYEFNGGTRRLTFQRLRVGIAGNPVYYNITLGTSKTYHFILENNTSNNTINIYIDGVMVATAGSSNLNGTSTEADLTAIGTYGTSLFANAKIQLARIYNRVLSQDEKQLLYLESLRKLGPTATPKYPSLLSGLVGYWDMKGTAHNLVDGTLATVTGATLTQDRFGNSNSAYSFDGINDFIGTNITTGLSLSFSFNLWIKTNTSAYQSLIHSHVASYNNLWTNVSVDSGGKIRFQMFDGTNNPFVDSTIFINDNNWHLITCERNVISDKLRIYIDGNYNNETTDTTTSTPTYSVFNLGVRGDGTKTGWYNGQIGDCFFFNRAFSADEIKTLYDLTSQDYIYPTPSYDIASLRDGLVLDLNEQGFDLSGNGNNGTLVNSPAVVRQGRAKGLSYNGSNQYTTFGTGLYDNIKTINNYAFSFWIKLNSLTGGGVIYSTQTNVNFYLYFDANGRSRLRREANFSDGANGDFYTGKWAHYVVNYTGATTADLYRDGIKIVSNYNISPTTNSSLGFIYGAYYDNSLKINGQIISPKIWNRVLSDKEIQALYYSQKANFIY